MSADLLRRAAKALREHAEVLPEMWREQPWRVVQTDTESLDGIAACTDSHLDDLYGAHDCCWSSESVGHTRVASYAVLMHPPVALALATVLENLADGFAAQYPALVAPEVYALARAILREES